MNDVVSHGSAIEALIPAVTTDFKNRAKKVIGQYIKSAILIDDDWPDLSELESRIALDASTEAGEHEVETEADQLETNETQAEIFISAVGAPTSFPVHAVASSSRVSEATRLLKIQDFFLKEGVICTGFKYKTSDKDRAPKLAKNADIVILDWNFGNDGGAGAVGILKALTDGHLRFICIFTDQPDLSVIKKRILEDVCGESFIADNTTDFKAKNFIFTLRNKAIPGSTSENKSLEADLFDDALLHLSTHYCGFLQLAMLELTARHRSSLLKHLVRFSQEYDTAFLTESSLQHSPFADSDLRAILIDEWKVALETSVIDEDMQILGDGGRSAFAISLADNCGKVTQKYMNECMTAVGLSCKPAEMDAFFKVVQEKDLRTFDIQVSDWLNKGAKECAPAPKSFKDENIAKWNIALLYALSNPNVATTPSLSKVYKFVFGLDALFNQQQVLPSELTQGTILKYDADHFLICITPLCDTARLGTGHYPYTFLSATRAKNEEPFKRGDYCVIMDGTMPVCLHVDIKNSFVYEIDPHSRKLAIGKPVEMYPLTFPRVKANQKTAENAAAPVTSKGSEVSSPLRTVADVTGTPPNPHSNTVSNADKDSATIKNQVGPGDKIKQDSLAAAEVVKTEPALKTTVVGQLRSDFFLMLTAAAASSASRVGVNRVELIRVQMK